MENEINLKAINLLGRLANSVAARDPNLTNFCFNLTEIGIVETWLIDSFQDFVKNKA